MRHSAPLHPLSLNTCTPHTRAHPPPHPRTCPPPPFQVFQALYYNSDVAVKIINLDGDDTYGEETLAKYKQEVDLQRRLSHHPNVVRFIGACCELPAGLPDLGRGLPAASLSARGMKLAIVMELCKLGSVFTMIGQARKVGGGGHMPEGLLHWLRLVRCRALAWPLLQ